jgi:hypothetical protein
MHAQKTDPKNQEHLKSAQEKKHDNNQHKRIFVTGEKCTGG